MSEEPRTVVFAGGGTGGHLYPALAIAERLPAGCRAVFLCSSRAIDAQILSKAGVEFVPLPAVPPGKKPKQLLAFARGFVASFRTTRDILQRARAGGSGAVALVAMGGFVCPPAAMAARALRVPVTLVNLDAEPGKANRFVDRFAARVFTAAEGARVPRNWTRVGPILRRSILVEAPRERSRRELGLAPDVRTLLVSGGSLGASTINGALRLLAQREPEVFRGWQVFHQAGADAPGSGEAHLVALREAYAKAGVPAVVAPFCDAMGHAWNAADLAVCRSGAGTVAEVLGTATPAVFLPYPYHADEHQKKNAQRLADAGGCVILADRIDPEKNLPALRDTLRTLMQNGEQLDAMHAALASLAPADGAFAVANNLAW